VLSNLSDRKLRVFPNRKEGKVEVNGVFMENNTLLDHETVQHAIILSCNRKKSQESESRLKKESEIEVQKKLADMETYQVDMMKQISEVKMKLEHLDKTNKETQHKVNEILALLSRSYGTQTTHK
jgi:hypothetical protein